MSDAPRKRSPDYPMYGLNQCVAVSKKIFLKIHSFSAARETVAIAAGFKGITGTSLSMMSALQKYGLMTTVGKELKFSDLGLKVLAPQSSEEYNAALVEAAFTPSLFQELKGQYHGMVPSDDLLRSNLIRRGFLADSADKAIEAYKDTLSLVGPLQNAYDRPHTTGVATPGSLDASQMEGSDNDAEKPQPATAPAGGRAPVMDPPQPSPARHNVGIPPAGENRPLGRLRRRVVLDDGLLEVNAVVDLRGLSALIRLLQAQETIMRADTQDEDAES